MILAAATGPSPFWFVTRGTGAIALVLLTLSISLGVVNVRRTRIGEMPRFVLDSVHRSASLLAVTFLAVHIATALMDGFAPITLLDVVIPFGSAYRPLWVGFGTVAFDLMVGITITSLLRRRLGYGAWRATHWLAYASWPVALLHGLGTGSDAKTHWMLGLTAGCVAVMLAAVLARVSAGWPRHLVARLGAVGAAALVPVGLLAWLPSGPLAAGWAKRAGTPASLIAGAHGASAGATSAGSAGSAARTPSGGASAGGSVSNSTTSFTAATDGRVRQVQLAGGLMLVDISLTIHGQPLSNLHIRIRGEPINGGGVQMSSSRVTLGPSSNPDQYSGRVTALQGAGIAARVADAASSALSVIAQLQISPGPGTATGTVTATPGRGSA
jgi:sulfoxide reductase heme-binding subunit YedZ